MRVSACVVAVVVVACGATKSAPPATTTTTAPAAASEQAPEGSGPIASVPSATWAVPEEEKSVVTLRPADPDTPAVNAAISKLRAPLRACHHKTLVAGYVKLRLTLDAEGHATKCNVDASSLPTELTKCVVATCEGLMAEGAPAGSYRFPITFDVK